MKLLSYIRTKTPRQIINGCLYFLRYQMGRFFLYITPLKEKGVTEKEKPELIVSLTSYPDRIPYIHKTINTLLNQTLKPDRLILWLADSQFPNKEEDLPQNLLKLIDLGLEIRWCEDLRSYKKLIPALKEFPNDIIVTADDDLYYTPDWLESLYCEYLKNPKYIYVKRASRNYFEEDNLKSVPLKESLFMDFSKR